MKEKIVKMGVVGLGRGVSVISKVIGDKNMVLRAICDKNPERLQEAKKYFEEEHKVENLLCFESLDEILKSDIDAVFIATDAPLHTPQAIQALNAGKHVLSEIPSIDSLEDAKKIKEATKAHPELKYMVAENCCYWAFIQAWKEMFEAGKFGEAVYAESEYFHPREIKEIKAEDYPAGYWRKSYDAIKYLTHNLGPLLYIMDDRCVSVSCVESDIRYNPYKTASECGAALFKTEKGAIIRILICHGAYTGVGHNFALYGTRGAIETDKTKNSSDAHSFARFSDIPGSFGAKIDIPVTRQFPGENYVGGHGGADIKMVRAFIKCIIEDTKPPIDVDLGIRMALPGIYAHESAIQGGNAIEIPDIE